MTCFVLFAEMDKLALVSFLYSCYFDFLCRDAGNASGSMRHEYRGFGGGCDDNDDDDDGRDDFQLIFTRIRDQKEEEKEEQRRKREKVR